MSGKCHKDDSFFFSVLAVFQERGSIKANYKSLNPKWDTQNLKFNMESSEQLPKHLPASTSGLHWSKRCWFSYFHSLGLNKFPWERSYLLTHVGLSEALGLSPKLRLTKDFYHTMGLICSFLHYPNDMEAMLLSLNNVLKATNRQNLSVNVVKFPLVPCQAGISGSSFQSCSLSVFQSYPFDPRCSLV